jgi:hypothetical protein
MLWDHNENFKNDYFNGVICRYSAGKNGSGNGWHGTSVLFTSHLKDGLVVNLYIPHNRRMPLQAEEALGPISISRGSRGVGKKIKN